MSVKELSFEDKNQTSFDVWMSGEEFYITINAGAGEQAAAYLDRNQAHMLMLYLQEHLK